MNQADLLDHINYSIVQLEAIAADLRATHDVPYEHLKPLYAEQWRLINVAGAAEKSCGIGDVMERVMAGEFNPDPNSSNRGREAGIIK